MSSISLSLSSFCLVLLIVFDIHLRHSVLVHFTHMHASFFLLLVLLNFFCWFLPVPGENHAPALRIGIRKKIYYLFCNIFLPISSCCWKNLAPAWEFHPSPRASAGIFVLIVYLIFFLKYYFMSVSSSPRASAGTTGHCCSVVHELGFRFWGLGMWFCFRV